MDNPGLQRLTIEIKRRVRLEGAELEEYLRHEKTEASKARQKAELAKKEKEELESSDESDTEMDTEVEGGKTGGVVGSQTAPLKTKYDLMMKSENKGRTGFFKQAKKAYPMFPLVEEKIKWDDYGEIIRAEDFIILEPTNTEEEKMDVGVPEDPSMQDISEVPTKCVITHDTLDVCANVIFIDFEGRSDGESLRKILGQTKPRELIIVHGTKEATKSLATYCRNTRDIVQGRVFEPSLNEVIDVTTESHIYQVKLKDSVVSALDFAKAKDIELAWIDARLDLSKAKTDTSATYVNEYGETVKMITDRDDSHETDEPIDLVPTLLPHSQNQVASHTAVFINEPKLSDFKQVVIKEGIQAEFVAGVLICNNMVAVRRNEAGRLQLEGCLCDDYYRVRDLLYEQYAIV
ncbi:Cleavage and polyadenylation specificity factor subunit 2 [Lamellibrachia satsuma]|nr:Cleavage and polyadenylation specificity factor subunit 2 [Lamellibrachia satsuma]